MKTKEELFEKMEWEGGISDSINGYGLRGEHFLEAGFSRDTARLVDEFAEAFRNLYNALVNEGYGEQ